MHQHPYQFKAGLMAMIFSVAGIFSTPVFATPFEYQSTCESDCENIGLMTGDSVGGTIGFSDAAVASGDAGFDDVESFDVTFGTFNFGLASLGSASALFDSSGATSFEFEFVTNAALTEPGYRFSQSEWEAGSASDLAATGGAGTLTSISPAAVPEPITLALLAFGVAGIAYRRRRDAE